MRKHEHISELDGEKDPDWCVVNEIQGSVGLQGAVLYGGGL